MFALARKFFDHVIPGIIRPLRVLWNEVIGFFFLVLAIWSLPTAYRSFNNFNGELDGLARIFLTAIFGLVMLFFGIYSFRRARKIGKS